jgi:alpha-glucosidase
MVNILLLGLLACSSVINAIPITQEPTDVASILTRRAEVDACPGYTATNVVEDESGLTADLTLSGDACNAYSDDIKDLKLLVEYQTGKYQVFYLCLIYSLTFNRRPPSHQDLRRC